MALPAAGAGADLYLLLSRKEPPADAASLSAARGGNRRIRYNDDFLSPRYARDFPKGYSRSQSGLTFGVPFRDCHR
ncbi:MAG: hypothetical protein KAJ98_00805 [Spirochaetaceae bacterium]|nr:hypothetical protein [Spirochaetaceae bacterium]